jgi:hypothetical protein
MSDAEWAAKREMAKHLMHEHGWGVRAIGRRLGLSDAEVKRATARSGPVWEKREFTDEEQTP